MILKVIVGGRADGTILKSTEPINFLGNIDKETGVISGESSGISGKSVRDYILVFPHGIGSSVGAYTIYSLKSCSCAPRAMICTRADLTVASGCALGNIPMVLVDEAAFNGLCSGMHASLDTDSKILEYGDITPPRDS